VAATADLCVISCAWDIYIWHHPHHLSSNQHLRFITFPDAQYTKSTQTLADRQIGLGRWVSTQTRWFSGSNCQFTRGYTVDPQQLLQNRLIRLHWCWFWLILLPSVPVSSSVLTRSCAYRITANRRYHTFTLLSNYTLSQIWTIETYWNQRHETWTSTKMAPDMFSLWRCTWDRTAAGAEWLLCFLQAILKGGDRHILRHVEWMLVGG